MRVICIVLVRRAHWVRRCGVAMTSTREGERDGSDDCITVASFTSKTVAHWVDWARTGVRDVARVERFGIRTLAEVCNIGSY